MTAFAETFSQLQAALPPSSIMVHIQSLKSHKIMSCIIPNIFQLDTSGDRSALEHAETPGKA
jgi:hypothetical protein